MTKYRGVDMSKLAGTSLGGGGFTKKTWWKAKNPKKAYEIRVLPPVGGMEALPWFEASQHFNGFSNRGYEMPGRDRDLRTSALYSLAVHGGVAEEDDPFCVLTEWVDEEMGKEIAKKVRATSQFFMNVYDVAGETIHPFGAPWTVANLLKGLMEGRTGDVTDLKKGRNLEITRFEATPWYQLTPLDKEPLDLADGWEEEATDFTKLITLLTPEQCYAVMWHNLRQHIPLNEVFPDVDFAEHYIAMYPAEVTKGTTSTKKAAKKTAKKAVKKGKK